MAACSLPPPCASHPCALHAAAIPATNPQILEQLLLRQDLSEEVTSGALQTLVAGAEPAQMAAFLVLLRAKGETAEEVAGLAKAMRAMSVPVHTSSDGAGGRGAWVCRQYRGPAWAWCAGS